MCDPLPQASRARQKSCAAAPAMPPRRRSAARLHKAEAPDAWILSPIIIIRQRVRPDAQLGRMIQESAPSQYGNTPCDYWVPAFGGTTMSKRHLHIRFAVAK